MDGLRGLAAYTVVVSHFSNATGIFGGLLGEGAGQVGVLLFFVLSGFLMGRLYLDQPLSGAGVATFLRRRFARVVPLYLIVVLASFAAMSWFGRSWPLFRVDRTNLGAHLLFLDGAGILWTVPTEVQFYLLFPLLWLAARRLGTSMLLLLPLATAIAMASPLTRPLLLRHLPYFLAGVFVALLPPPRERRYFDAAFVVALLVYLATLPKIAAALGLNAGAMCSPSVYLIAVPALLAATLHSPLADRVFGHPVAAFAGRISYSVYLWHMPVLLLLGSTAIAARTDLFLVAFLAATTLVAWVSFRLIEDPLRRRLDGRGR